VLRGHEPLHSERKKKMMSVVVKMVVELVEKMLGISDPKHVSEMSNGTSAAFSSYYLLGNTMMTIMVIMYSSDEGIIVLTAEADSWSVKSHGIIDLREEVMSITAVRMMNGKITNSIDSRIGNLGKIDNPWRMMINSSIELFQKV
jgi:hypothetical protein